MLISELLFVGITYFTLWLYKQLFKKNKYLVYFISGAVSWILYLLCRTAFQFYYLKNEPVFKGNSVSDIIINNVTVVIVCFLFITACKYFKDGYITQQFEVEKKQQQLMAEVDNLKSQIAPHFLFNTLNNLYGLAVDKSDKLPGLMLRLSGFLRHSLYETQKSLILITDEIEVIKSYIELESVRLEDDLEMEFNSEVPPGSQLKITPLILIVFIENAFKHARFIQSGAVKIFINTFLEDDWFTFIIMNNYNNKRQNSENGIGLANVIRRLEVLYPNQEHRLSINKDEVFYTVTLQLQLVRTV